MEKKVSLFLIALFTLSIFYISLILAQDKADSSTNDVTITVNGCEVNGMSFDVGSCSSDKKYYCVDHKNYQDVFKVANACSKGKLSVVANDVCCPSGTYSCRNPQSGETGYVANSNYCFPATQDCSDYTTQADCKKSDISSSPDDFHGGQCYWTESDGGKCVPRIDSCYELSENECKDQKISGNVSRNDVNCRHGEYIVGGNSYVISEENCECFWDDNKCKLKYNYDDLYGDPSHSTFGRSNCTYSYVLNEDGKCVDGLIKYTYAAIFSKSNKHPSILEGDALCVNRTGARACGQPVVKVPFFSLFNVIFVILLIFVFYMSQTKFFKKKKK